MTEHPDFYGDGLALGTGEITLYALARAYAALARGGELRPLAWVLDAAYHPARVGKRRAQRDEADLVVANGFITTEDTGDL